MVITSLILLLLSNAITLRRDKSILYSRATITILLISSFIAYDNLFFVFLNKGIGIFGGLFHTTATTNVIHIVIFIISSAMLIANSFCIAKACPVNCNLLRLLFTKWIYYKPLIANKMGKQFKIIEYSFIILFIIILSFFITSSVGPLILLSCPFIGSILFFSHLNRICILFTAKNKLFSCNGNHKYFCPTSIEKYLANVTTLQSGHNFFIVKFTTFYITIYYTESFSEDIFYYNTLYNAYYNSFLCRKFPGRFTG